MNYCQNIRETLPANKFQPPHLKPGHAFVRRELFKQNLSCQKRLFPKVLFIQAQAGQGKTTVALQYLEKDPSPFSWYQMGPEDQDPILFFSALLVSLSHLVPSLASSQLMEMLEDGNIGVMELPGCVDMLFQELVSDLAGDIRLVFDDLHLIEMSQPSLALLNSLVQSSPESIRFLLISRRPVQIQALSSDSGIETVHLGNGQLALSSMDIMELFKEVLHSKISWETAVQLQKRTSGWIMGVILAAHLLKKGEEQLHSMPVKNIEEYFKKEILSQLPDEIRKILLRLSFLDEIDIPLVKEITGMDNIEQDLQDLVDRNFFLQVRGGNNRIFVFHHLFQDFLRQQGKEELSLVEINSVLEQAAVFSLDQERIERCLSYYLRAGNIQALESVLKQEGGALLAHNRHMTIYSLLNQVPPDCMVNSLWLRLYLAMSMLDMDPESTIPLLSELMDAFARTGEKVGELLAGSQLLYGHFIFTALYENGTAILPKMKELFAEMMEDLLPHSRIMVAKNLAMSSVIMMGDIKGAGYYSTLAMELSKRYSIKNYIGATLLSKGYEHLLPGHSREVAATAEQAYDYISHTHISVINRFALLTFLHNLSDSMNDEVNYQQHKSLITQTNGGELLGKTLVGPSLLIWDIGLAIGKGRFAEAEQIINQAHEYGALALNPHIQSQFSHWQALLAALKNDLSATLAATELSLELRAISGSLVFIVLNRIILGSAHTLVEQWKTAETFLEEALNKARDHRLKVLEASALLHRGFLHLQCGAIENAKDDVAAGIELMRIHHYNYFLSWNPTTILPVLQFAVDQGIEVKYSTFLAKERMMLSLKKESPPVPLLCITLFGGFTVKIEGKTICQSEELTPAWRQILSMLIFSDGQCVESNIIQSELWPDKSPEKARSALDTQFSRLRKFLRESLAPCSPKDYFLVTKGLARLINCRIDVLDFIGFAEKGLAHGRNHEWWQAGNNFRNALQLWQKGRFSSALLNTELAYSFSIRLHNTFVKMSLAWSKHLLATNRVDEALELLETAWLFDQSRADMAAALFQVHLKKNTISQARTILDQFEEILRLKKYSKAEIMEMRSDILKQAEQSVS